MSRHLICLIDGTWVSADHSVLNETYSNVYELAMLLKNHSGSEGDREDNIIFYSRGLGSHRNRILRYTSGGFATGLEDEIAGIYINLASNYQEGDKIYLFGFSRGSVVARAVAGLIGTIGLLKDHHINAYKEVWKTYRDGAVPSPQLLSKCEPNAHEIEFLGVFDTVYGGKPNKRRLLDRLGFHNDKLPSNIRYAVHILSLDDRRIFFQPILWSNGSSENAEQIWMPGVHSDIGGTQTPRFFGDVSLLAMIDRIKSKSCLSFHENKLAARYEHVCEQLDKNYVYISDELKYWLWKLARPVPRVFESCYLNQSIHPIVQYLRDQNIHIRGKKIDRYKVHASFDNATRSTILEHYPVPRRRI